MVSDARVARLRAYELLEAAQGDAPDQALAELVDLEAVCRERGWDDGELLAATGRAVHALQRGGPDLARPLAEDLVVRAERADAPGRLASALALRAVGAAGRDSAALLADAGRAVVLVEDVTLPPLDRCLALVVAAAAYNTLSLWELVDELFAEASALAPDCEQPLLEPAVVVNRMLVRLEWATALFELGEQRAALDQLHRAADAVRLAADVELPQQIWRVGVRACGDLVRFVLTAFGELEDTPDDLLRAVEAHRSLLQAGADVEILPLLDALLAFGLVRLGRRDEAVARVRRSVASSPSSGSRSFPAWVRVQVLAGDGPGEALAAHQEYGVLVSRSRWSARQAVLAAARSSIAAERLGAENRVLARDVLLDPLTGLSNRRSFDDWLAAVPDEAQATALILIDLDDFKTVNDLHGHAIGDEALRRVGRTLANHVRPGDLALRLGGDEFAVVLAGEPDVAPGRSALDALEEAAAGRARALREAVAGTDWDRIAPGLALRLSAGVAVAVLGPDDVGAADRLYRSADAELYEAKAAPGAAAG